MFRKYLIIITAFFLYVAFVCGENMLSWHDCIKEAQNHPELQAAREKVGQARMGKSIAQSARFPSVNADAGKRWREENTTSSLGLSGRLLLFDGLGTRSNIRYAAKNILLLENTYKTVSSQLRLRLRKAFLELLKFQELLNITKTIFKRRTQNLELVELRYEVGKEHKGALLSAEADAALAEFDVKKTQRAMFRAQRSLLRELQRNADESIYVVDDMDIKETEEPNVSEIAKNTLSVEAARIRKQLVDFGIQSAKSEFFPKIHAQANTSKTQTRGEWENDWYVGLSASFSVFEGGRRINALKKARSLEKEAQQDKQSIELAAFVNLERAWTNFADAQDSIIVKQKFLDAAKQRAKIAQAEYGAGILSFDNWTIIENNLANAQKALLEAQISVALREAEWIYAQGGTLNET